MIFKTKRFLPFAVVLSPKRKLQPNQPFYYLNEVTLIIVHHHRIQQLKLFHLKCNQSTETLNK